ncbi:MAG TPA: dihydrolipoamide acetyltransferase family protein [Ktedonobacterales bacterium]|nr:dihydrolipoamide acetyltransferase family protein [Ktedonobacterales bacterium]
MSTRITMPQLGESVSEGTVGRWLKQEGETIKRDEPLVEIITDKVTAEYPSPVTGRVVKILVKEDETVKVGAEIAEIEEAGATTSASSTSTAASSNTPSASGNGGVSSASVPGAGVSNGASATASAPRASSTTATLERVSPLARRMAQEHQIDLNQIQGTGENGRIRKEDIMAHLAQPTPSAPAAPAPAAPAPVAPPAPAPRPTAPAMPVAVMEGDQLINPSPARRVIAEHMVRSKQTSPHATTVFEVDMTNLARWLASNKDGFRQREGYGISFQTFAVKAAVEALREYPYVNASWTEDNKILLRHNINVGISIALENNLIVPVIRNADILSLAGIARAMSDLVARARTNRLMPDELQGGTFTVNNPGVFGTMMSMSIINQPNAAILTMDAVVKRPVVIGDAIAIRDMMYMSISFDHRILDGLTAAQFMGAIKRRLENPGSDIQVY